MYKKTSKKGICQNAAGIGHSEAGTPKTQIKKGAKVEEVIHRLKEMICFNELAPGQKLICSALTQKLNVSTTSVTQVLNRLKASGLIEYKSNRDNFFADISDMDAVALQRQRGSRTQYHPCFYQPNVEDYESKPIGESVPAEGWD